MNLHDHCYYQIQSLFIMMTIDVLHSRGHTVLKPLARSKPQFCLFKYCSVAQHDDVARTAPESEF